MNSLPAGPPDPHPRGAPPVTLACCEPAPGRAKSPQRPAVAPPQGEPFGPRSGPNGDPLYILLRGPTASSAASRRCGQPRLWARRCTRRGRGPAGTVAAMLATAGARRHEPLRSAGAWPGRAETVGFGGWTLTGHRTDDAASPPCGDHRAGPPHRTTGRPGHGESPAPEPVVGSAGTRRSAGLFSGVGRTPARPVPGAGARAAANSAAGERCQPAGRGPHAAAHGPHRRGCAPEPRPGRRDRRSAPDAGPTPPERS